MGQNFRYYTDYANNDIQYYEKTHKSKASVNGRLYKNFLKWLIKLRNQMNQFNFSYEDIERFERKNLENALWSGKPTKKFLKYLDDRKQLKITDFF